MAIPTHLAPMAGVTDIAFRRLCRAHAEVDTCLDMVSARGLADRKAVPPLLPGEGVQLVGNEPRYLALAAARFPEAAFVDLNAGCPVRKVVRKGMGAALLKEPEVLRACAQAILGATDRPVSVKVRLGWDRETLAGTARALDGLGLARVTVHGRTARVMVNGRIALASYADRVDLDAIRRAVDLFDCPVVGNGDVDSFAAAAAMVEATGCDGVMVGRAAMHDPLVFADIQEGRDRERTRGERAAIFAEYARGAAEAGVPFIEVRSHAVWLARGFSQAARARAELMRTGTAEQALAVLRGGPAGAPLVPEGARAPGEP